MTKTEPIANSGDQLTPLADELAARLPSGWVLSRLGTLCEKSQYGWTTKANMAGHGVKFLRTTDITPGFVDWETVPYCFEEPDDLEKYLIRDGDILISRAGSIGVSHLVTKPEPAVFASYLIRFRPRAGVSATYLRYYLQSPMYWRAIGAGKKGIAVQNVNASTLSQIPVPVPPAPVQDKIVAEIEKQFSRLDEAVANLKRVKANLKRYKAAVLKAAVEGRLVPIEVELARRVGRSYETGAQLLQRILETRRSQWKGNGNYKEPTPIGPATSPQIPEGWIWASADQVTSVITDGEHITPKRVEIGVLLLSARNILDGRLSLDNVDYVPQTEYDRIAKRLVINPGDVLLSCSGSVGRSTIAPEGLIFTLVRSVAVLKPMFGMGEYVSLVLRSPLLQQEISEKKTQTAQANIFQGKIRTLRIPLPPLAEQRRIVAEVDRCLSIVRELMAEVDANLQRAAALRRSILHEAFRGSYNNVRFK